LGTRAQVKVVSDCEHEAPVFLYQHYDGDQLLKTVKKAIRKKQRWNDFEYLCRIIFSEMIKDYINDETGYGIGTNVHSDLDYLIVVDLKTQTITECNYYDTITEEITFQEVVNEGKHKTLWKE